MTEASVLRNVRTTDALVLGHGVGLLVIRLALRCFWHWHHSSFSVFSRSFRRLCCALTTHETYHVTLRDNSDLFIDAESYQKDADQYVFVTDGSCMASTACQNPSLTYMALTARAADHAVAELNRRNL